MRQEYIANILGVQELSDPDFTESRMDRLEENQHAELYSLEVQVSMNLTPLNHSDLRRAKIFAGNFP